MKLRTLAKIVGGLITILILAALAAPMFISSDTLKAQLVAQVKKATGRTLEIKGETSVTLFPNIAVTAEEVSLSNPEGFNDPIFVSLKKLSTGAQLMPLLHGELLINGITLDGAVIHLEQKASGAKNWEFTAEKIKDSADKAADAPEAQKNSSSPLKRFALGDVTITDSTVTYLKPGAKQIRVEHINASIQGADANSPLKVEGDAEYNGETVNLALDIAKTKEFLSGQDSTINASLGLPGASMDFTGSGHLGESMMAKGAFNASIASLPKVMEWATGTKPGNVPQQITIKTDLVYAPNEADLKQLTLKADSLTANGSLHATFGKGVPNINGALTLGDVALDSLLKKKNGSETAAGTNAAATTTSTEWSDAAIDLSALKAVNADLTLGFTSLKSGKLALGAGSLGVRLNAGALAANLKQLQLYEGTAKGTLNASPGGIGMNMQFSGVNIDTLLNALMGGSRLEGKADLAMDVTAKGNSQRAWVNSLNGKGSLSVADGALKGINIGQFLREAKKGFLQESDAVSTDFSELKGSFTIASGVVSNQDLSMKSPALRVAGSGTVSLPPKTVNYTLRPTVVATSKGQGGKDDLSGVTVPLIITGPWSKPSVTPDLQAMLKDPELMKNNIKNISEGIKDFNSADDIKRALLGEKSGATATDTATPADATTPEQPLSKKEQRQKMIENGVGSLLKGL